MYNSNTKKSPKKRTFIIILVCFFISFYDTLLHHLNVVNLTVFKLLLTNKHSQALIDLIAHALGASFGLPMIFASLACLFPIKNKSRKTIFKRIFIYTSIAIASFQLLSLIIVKFFIHPTIKF